MSVKKLAVSSQYPTNVILMLVYGHILVKAMAGKTCPPSYLEECFYSNENISFSHNLSRAIPVFDNLSLEWICRSYIAREECVLRHEQECPDQHAAFDAKENAIRYLCNEGKEEYIRSRECFQDVSLLNKISVCNVTYHVQTGTLTGSGTSIDVTRRKLCNYLLEFLDCLKASANQECGTTAGGWLYNFNRQLSSSVLDKMQCPTGGVLHSAGVWGIVGGCIIALVCLIIITLLCKRRMEKEHAGGYVRNTSRGFSVASTARKSSTGAASKAYETTYVGTSPNKGSIYLSKQSSVVATTDTTNETSTTNHNRCGSPKMDNPDAKPVDIISSCGTNKESPTYAQQETQTCTP